VAIQIICCPHCGKQVKVLEEYLGRKMRCPHAGCRQAFRAEASMVVQEAGSPATKAQTPEPSAPPAGPAAVAPAEVVDWQKEPPPAQAVPPPVAGTYESRSEAFAPPGAAALPDHGGLYATSGYEETSASAAIPVVDLAPETAPSRARTVTRVMLLFIALAVAATLAAAIYAFSVRRSNEAILAERAHKLVQEGKLTQAQQAFNDLAAQFPNSSNEPLYRFMSEWLEIRAAAQGSAVDVPTVYSKLQAFLKKHRDKTYYRERRSEVWEALANVSQAASSEAERRYDPEALKQAEEILKLCDDLASTVPDHEAALKRLEDLKARLGKAQHAVAAQQAKKKVLTAFDDFFKEKTPGAVDKAEHLLQELVIQYPDFAGDKELQARIATFRENEVKWIRYVPAAASSASKSPPPEVSRPALVFAPLVQGGPVRAQGIVIAVARGRLYALAAADGTILWSREVGPDVQGLPTRLPATPAQPEALLIPFSDGQRTIYSAVQVQDGKLLWHYDCGAMCQAQPIVAAGRIYLFATDGRVHELELAGGKPTGIYEIGQKITVGGSFDPRKRQLLVAGDHRRVFVLDIDRRECVAVHYTEHTAGSLLAPPLLIGDVLLLLESAELQMMRVRAFRLPTTDSGLQTLAEYNVQGWATQPPYFDGEILAFITDRQLLALFAVRRGSGSRDREVFPLVKPMLVPAAKESSSQSAGVGLRNVVVGRDIRHWWILSGGLLRRLHVDYYRQTVTAHDVQPIPYLGSALHGPQAPDPEHPYVYLVTQVNKDQVVCTGLDTSSGRIIWQRQLGLSPTTKLLPGDNEVLLVESNGGFLRASSTLLAASADRPVSVETWTPPVHNTSWVWFSFDPSQGYLTRVTYLDTSRELLVERQDRTGKMLSTKHPLPAEPAGEPAVTDNGLIVFLRDGSFYDLPWSETQVQPRPHPWLRARRSAHTVCRATMIGSTELMVSDGGRTLQRWRRSAPGSWVPQAAGSVELPADVASPLLPLPWQNDTYVAVVTTDHILCLASLERVLVHRQFSLGAPATFGPFRVGDRIGVVVRSQLQVFAPHEEKPVWTFDIPPPGPAGPPLTLPSALVLTCLNGELIYLDPRNGKVLERTTLPGPLAPTGSPAPLNTSLLIPLSDGTCLVVQRPH